jgi:hypothetical protein
MYSKTIMKRLRMLIKDVLFFFKIVTRKKIKKLLKTSKQPLSPWSHNKDVFYKTTSPERSGPKVVVYKRFDCIKLYVIIIKKVRLFIFFKR